MLNIPCLRVKNVLQCNSYGLSVSIELRHKWGYLENELQPLSDVCRRKKSSKTVKAKRWGGDTEHLIPLSREGRSPWASLYLYFFSPSSRSLSTRLPVPLSTLAGSLGHVQSEALWPIRQPRGRAPLLSFSFLVCLYNLSSVCIQVEHLELTPHRAGYTYLHSQNLPTSSWAVFTHPSYLP